MFSIDHVGGQNCSPDPSRGVAESINFRQTRIGRVVVTSDFVLTSDEPVRVIVGRADGEVFPIPSFPFDSLFAGLVQGSPHPLAC